MKRWLCTILLFLLLGAVVNVAVAWGLHVATIEGWLQFLPFQVMEANDRISERWDAVGQPDWRDPPDVGGLTAFGVRSYYMIKLHKDEALVLTVDRYGWPANAFEAEHARRTRANPDGGADLDTVVRRTGLPIGAYELPVRPLWPGLVVNLLLFAVILWLFTRGPFAMRRLIRRWRGRCLKCGYDLRGEFDAGCPECGWNRVEAGSAR